MGTGWEPYLTPGQALPDTYHLHGVPPTAFRRRNTALVQNLRGLVGGHIGQFGHDTTQGLGALSCLTLALQALRPHTAQPKIALTAPLAAA